MKRFTLEERGAEIDRILAEGRVRVPPVEQLRRAPDAPRTESKRRLLETLARVAPAQGRKPPFGVG